MPKKFFKKISPHPDKVKNHKSLKFISHLLNDPNLWHFNRRSVPKAFGIGTFCAFLPVPFQMPLAAILAISRQANLSLAIILVWITNPLTMGPIFYGAYRLGCYILNTPEFSVNTPWSFETIYLQFMVIWKPLWIGCLIISTIASFISYYSVKIMWYLVVLNKAKYKIKY